MGQVLDSMAALGITEDGAWNDGWSLVRYNAFRFWRVVIALSRRKGVGYGWRRS